MSLGELSVYGRRSFFAELTGKLFLGGLDPSSDITRVREGPPGYFTNQFLSRIEIGLEWEIGYYSF